MFPFLTKKIMVSLPLILIAFSLCEISLAEKRRLVIGVDGGTTSIRASVFDAKTGAVIGTSVCPYETFHPKAGWAEQSPQDWYDSLGTAVREAVEKIPCDENEHEICSICVDTTCCSVVALDDKNEPLRRCLLWMDQRSAPQTEEIMEKCKGDPALNVNSGGEGPISAEWMTPKALWLKQNEPDVWKKAETICEYQDYINYRLTGQICASCCNAASRWHWNGQECMKYPNPNNPYPGRPVSLYKKLGIPELASKLPQRCLPMGALVGNLTPEAAEHLNLPLNLPVAQGGPDAFVGMVGLGCVNPGQLCLITGSSHLHCVVSSKAKSSPGIWGAYRGAPLSGINFAEGGQSSTGSILSWARNIFGASDIEYSVLDAEAAKVAPGCEGLIALETFQGSRTPITDPKAKGALLGLTLSHTRAHIWRALLESVCFGTRACIEGLENAGHNCDEITIAGGATRSKFWLQMHADVTGKPVVVCENSDAPLLGCAILASVNAKIHPTVEVAVAHMVRRSERVEPSRDAETYSSVYESVYRNVGASVQPISHAIAGLPRGGDSISTEKSGKNKAPIISPSLLACDFSNIKAEIDKCIDAGTPRLHVDIFDGVGIDSPDAFTFGPQMVKALRKSSGEKIEMDLHMCVDRPARYVKPMKEAGANLFIFQWEAMSDENEAMELINAVVDSGMACGLSINPSTPVDEIVTLLMSGQISVVDILAVEPGFGGQKFQASASKKIDQLLKLKESGTAPFFEIMVDGGINSETARKVKNVDVVVAGSSIFQHPVSMSQGVDDLMAAISEQKERE